MQRLNGVVKHIVALQEITGTNDKIDYLTTHKDDEDLWYILRVLFSNEYVLGIKKLQPIGLTSSTGTNLVPFEAVQALIEKLNNSNINDNLKHELNTLLKQCGKSTQSILIAVFQKTLKLGFTANTLNKIVPNFIPDFKVMLADTDDITKLKFPVRVDVKYDGVRCIAKCKDGKVTLFTRQGKVMKFPKIEHEIKLLLKDATQDYTLDGELEMTSDSRTDVSGICNSNIHKGYDGSSDTFLKYTVFDIIPTSVFEARGKTGQLKDRALVLSSLFRTHQSKHVFETKYSLAKDVNEVNELTNKLIAEGLEGTIIKDLGAQYQFKRSSAWLKQKAVNSCSLVVTGVTEGTNKRLGKIGALTCQTSDGKLTVDVGSGMSDEDIDNWTKKSPKGLIVEVLFNVLIKGRDSDVYSLFLPRLAPCKVRIDKDSADSLDDIIKQHIGKPQV